MNNYNYGLDLAKYAYTPSFKPHMFLALSGWTLENYDLIFNNFFYLFINLDKNSPVSFIKLFSSLHSGIPINL